MPFILLPSRRERREKGMTRTLPASVRGRDVVFGSGYAAAAFCATRRAAGFAPPIVFEQNLAAGGMFAQLLDFKLNSQNQASIASIESPGPSRVVSTSDVDDLNWIPNSDHQVGQYGAFEYPRSADMCRAIARTIREYGELYTGVVGMTFNRAGQVSTADGTVLGKAKRIIWAAGTVPRNDYVGGPAVMSGYDFMRTQAGELHNRRIAVLGGGDTAAQCVEYMLGQGLAAPATLPGEVHWYGNENMPVFKSSWAEFYHARFNGLARHFPHQFSSERSVIRPFSVKGQMINLGKTAMVNGLIYDLVIMATGFRPALCPVVTEETYRIGDMVVAKCNSNETIDGIPTVFKIGTAAGLSSGFTAYRSRFPAATLAMYNQGPRIAALAAALTS